MKDLPYKRQKMLIEFNEKRLSIQENLLKIAEERGLDIFFHYGKWTKGYWEIVLSQHIRSQRNSVKILYDVRKGSWRLKNKSRIYHSGVEAFEIWLSGKIKRAFRPRQVFTF